MRATKAMLLFVGIGSVPRLAECFGAQLVRRARCALDRAGHCSSSPGPGDLLLVGGPRPGPYASAGLMVTIQWSPSRISSMADERPGSRLLTVTTTGAFPNSDVVPSKVCKGRDVGRPRV